MVRSKAAAGVIAGLIAGMVFGMMMQMMSAPTPGGASMRMMAMVARVVRSDSIAVGWVYHLFNSAVVGLLFGPVLGSRASHYLAGFGWGAAYGAFWWVLGGLILMPVLLGMPAFAPLMVPAMRMVAIGSLMGHVIFGLILGGVFVKLHPAEPRMLTGAGARAA